MAALEETSFPQRPFNPLVNALLTDMYQITMAYAYWRAGRHLEQATFELFFRKCPFKGEYVVFAGLDQVIAFLRSYSFSESDVEYLKRMPSLQDCDPAFFEYLRTIDCSGIVVSAVKEGAIVFPRVTLISVSGPLIVGQLLETTLLNLVNFPSLIATNAARMRLAAGPEKKLLEFGLRRAQGPDGGVSASRYAYVGGFDGTSNVLAGKLTGMSVSGTHAHAFVQSYTGFGNIKDPTLAPKGGGAPVDFVARVLEIKSKEEKWKATNESELAAFVGYAQSFPDSFVGLVDTYDTLRSGVENFCIVALALAELGYAPLGIRLDSGDLAYLSRQCRGIIDATADKYGASVLRACFIVASNDINEEVLLALNSQGHAIDTFGIGTHLVTCQAQPALGCVYKLVEIEGQPRIKLSQEIAKVMLPGQKNIYRLISAAGEPLVDLICRSTEGAPEPGKRILCRHPFQENKRAYVTPSEVVDLLLVIWDGPRGISVDPSTIEEARSYSKLQLAALRNDVKRPLNATPYKVSVTASLYDFLHEMWQDNTPIEEIK